MCGNVKQRSTCPNFMLPYIPLFAYLDTILPFTNQAALGGNPEFMDFYSWKKDGIATEPFYFL